jgi:hypothetical protein
MATQTGKQQIAHSGAAQTIIAPLLKSILLPLNIGGNLGLQSFSLKGTRLANCSHGFGR